MMMKRRCREEGEEEEEEEEASRPLASISSSTCSSPPTFGFASHASSTASWSATSPPHICVHFQALPHLDPYPRRPPLRLPRPHGLRLPAHPLLGPSRRALLFAAIIPLAFWSMLMGTVTLKWFAGNLNRLFGDLVDAQLRDDDLDVMEMKEREKVVKHMWDIYAHRFQTQPPQFW